MSSPASELREMEIAPEGSEAALWAQRIVAFVLFVCGLTPYGTKPGTKLVAFALPR